MPHTIDYPENSIEEIEQEERERWSASKLLIEIRNAERSRDAKLGTFKRQTEAYVGPFFSNEGRVIDDDELGLIGRDCWDGEE